MSMNAYEREEKLDTCIKENITDDDYNKMYPTRSIFQISTDSYADSTMEEKVSTLKNLLNSNDYCTFEIAINMMKQAQNNGNDVEPLDLAIGMGKIIDYLLKENYIPRECCK